MLLVFYRENMNHCTDLVIDNSVFAKIIELNAIENLKTKNISLNLTQILYLCYQKYD